MNSKLIDVDNINNVKKKLLPWDKDTALDFAKFMREKYVNAVAGSIDSLVYYFALHAAANIAEYFMTYELSLLITGSEYWIDLYNAWLLDNRPQANFRLRCFTNPPIEYVHIEGDLINKHYPEYTNTIYVDYVYYGMMDGTPAERLIEDMY